MTRTVDTFRDRAGREIRLRMVEEGDAPRLRDALLEMYLAFGSEDRAQGVPPRGEDRISAWLTSLEDPLELVALDDDRVAAHAFLVPMDGRHELGVFVRPGYRRARIGARILDELLELGRDRGVSEVWLSVGRSNEAAKYLYRRAGFEVVEGASGELEMIRRLEG